MLEALNKLKVIYNSVKQGVRNGLHNGSAPEEEDYDALVNEIDTYASDNVVGNESDNLDYQLNELTSGMAGKGVDDVKQMYTDALSASVGITAPMVSNGDQITSMLFVSDSTILIVPTLGCNANVSHAFRQSAVQIVFDLPDMADVTQAQQVFGQCTALTHVNTRNWFTNGKLTNMNRMIFDCGNMQYIDARRWDTSKVTAAEGAFYNDASMKIDLPDCDANDPSGLAAAGYKKLDLSSCYDIRSFFRKACTKESVAGGQLPEKLYVKTPSVASGGKYVSADGFLSSMESANATYDKTTQASQYNNLRATVAAIQTKISEVYLEGVIENPNFRDGSGIRCGIFESRTGLAKVTLTDTSRMLHAYGMFDFCWSLVTIEGLDFSSLYLLKSQIVANIPNINATQQGQYFAGILQNTFRECSSLVNCEITGTIYKSGIDLTDCTSLSKASLVSFLAALYNWDANVENKTTDDQNHVFIIGDGLTETYVDYEKMEYVAYCVEPPEGNGSPMYTLDDFISPQGDMYNDGEYLVEALIYRANSRYDWSIEP